VKTREYVSIVRKIWAREEPLEHDGVHYQIPYRGPGATGLGKPLRSILHGRQIPIYIAAIGPKSVEQAAEIADGWLPVWYTPYRTHVYKGTLEAGFRRAGGGKSLASFDVAPTVMVLQGDDVQSCLDFVKPMLALYIGGMGARGKTSTTTSPPATASRTPRRRSRTCTSTARRRGRRRRPDQLADEVALVGPAARIRERLAPWRESGVTTMICGLRQPEAMRTLAEAPARRSAGRDRLGDRRARRRRRGRVRRRESAAHRGRAA